MWSKYFVQYIGQDTDLRIGLIHTLLKMYEFILCQLGILERMLEKQLANYLSLLFTLLFRMKKSCVFSSFLFLFC